MRISSNSIRANKWFHFWFPTSYWMEIFFSPVQTSYHTIFWSAITFLAFKTRNTSVKFAGKDDEEKERSISCSVSLQAEVCRMRGNTIIPDFTPKRTGKVGLRLRSNHTDTKRKTGNVYQPLHLWSKNFQVNISIFKEKGGYYRPSSQVEFTLQETTLWRCPLSWFCHYFRVYKCRVWPVNQFLATLAAEKWYSSFVTDVQNTYCLKLLEKH